MFESSEGRIPKRLVQRVRNQSFEVLVSRHVDLPVVGTKRGCFCGIVESKCKQGQTLFTLKTHQADSWGAVQVSHLCVTEYLDTSSPPKKDKSA